MLPGETISSGAPRTCEDCKTVLKEQVMMSPAGYYIGTMCKCGPYSRESGYMSKKEAEEQLKSGVWSR